LKGNTLRIEMLTTFSGTRDGIAWPDRGGLIDLPELEALELVAQGHALAVSKTEPKVETAAVKKSAETAVKKSAGRPRKQA
jgi:hypothetical protein